MAYAFNYDNYITNIGAFLNRNDTVFLSLCPVFLSLGEQRIFIDFSHIGTEQSYTGNFVAGNGIIAKPPLWGDTETFSYLDSTGRVHILERVAYEYGRTFIDNPSTQNDQILPTYYSDSGYGYFIIFPTPQVAFPFQLIFQGKEVPLGTTQPTNWYSTYGYDLLLFAACHEAAAYLDNHSQAAKWDGKYIQRLELYNRYNKGRKADRTSDVLKD